jgi:hypothetical protein
MTTSLRQPVFRRLLKNDAKRISFWFSVNEGQQAFGNKAGVGQPTPDGERRNVWGTVTPAFQLAVVGRCSIFVSLSPASSEYLFYQNCSSGCQSDDLAQAAGPWKYLNGRSSSYHSNCHELGQ